MCGFPLPSVQYQITVTIPFGVRYFPYIVATPLEIMGSILSVNMSSSEKIFALEELSTMIVDPSESNPTFSEYYTLEESMWHIISFEILYNTKGLFLLWTLGGLFIAFQMGLLYFVLSLQVMHFCLSMSVVGTLIHFILTLSSLDRLCKNKPPNMRMIYEAKKRWVKNPSGGFFTFCKINMYDLECFRCVCHYLLSRISLTLIPLGWYFAGLIIMVQHPFNW